MADTVSAPRLAYIRTVYNPNDEYDTIHRMLQSYVRQTYPDAPIDHNTPTNKQRHRFLFGACTTTDSHVLDIFMESLTSNPRYYRFQHLTPSDVEVHMSSSHAENSAGHSLLLRCKDVGIPVQISGGTASQVDEALLATCDYIIDPWTTSTHLQSFYWHTLRLGKPEDHMLSNPHYDVSQHDWTKWRLRDRYNGYGFRASSGAGWKGNGGYACAGCGGRCKRDRCRKGMGREKEDFLRWYRMPEKGSGEWGEVSAAEVMKMYRMQMVHQKSVEGALRESVDTFSGD